MNGVGKKFVSIQQFIFVDEDFLDWKKEKRKKKKNEKIIEKQRYITIKNKQEREWVKREMLRTTIHVRDTSRVPIGDVLIK